MEIKTITENIFNIIVKYLYVYKFAIKPKQGIKTVCSETIISKINSSIANLVILTISIAILSKYFFLGRYGNGLVNIAVFTVIRTLQYLPSMFLIILLLKLDLKKKFALAFYISSIINLITTLFFVFIYFIFIKTENYFYFYFSILGQAILTYGIILYWSITINIGKNKFVTFLVILGFLITNLLIHFLSTVNDEEIYQKLDPVFYEFTSNEIFDKSNVNLYLEGQILAIDILKNLDKNFKNEEIDDLKVIIDIIKNDKSDLLKLKEELYFRFSKDYVSFSIEIIEIMTDIYFYSTNLNEIPTDFQLDIDNLQSDLGLINNDLSSVGIILEEIEMLVERITLAYATRDKNLIEKEYRYLANYNLATDVTFNSLTQNLDSINKKLNIAKDILSRLNEYSLILKINNISLSEQNRWKRQVEFTYPRKIIFT